MRSNPFIAVACSVVFLSSVSQLQAQRISTAAFKGPTQYSAYSAQLRAPGGATPSRVGRSDQLEILLRLESRLANDHRWAGLIVGAIAVGAAGAVLGHSICENSETHHGSCLGATVEVGAVGAVAGGVVGGLIGRMIPKRE